MAARARLLSVVLPVSILTIAVHAHGQLAPNAPTDKPVEATSTQMRRIEATIAPYVERARQTYPEARARYLAGLPRSETFFVTARLTDARGRIEVVFVQVQRIGDGQINGRIASKIMGVAGYKQGGAYAVPEAAILDWTISKPDGSEEGNVAGQALD